MAKYGPAALPEKERRLTVSLSLSNKITPEQDYPRLRRFRDAAEAREGHVLSDAELNELAKTLAYRAIDAYSEGVERDNEAIIV